MNGSRLWNSDTKNFDVVVVGAGIAGCASARELAEAGYSVLLVDRGDFGAATSSRSSRNLYCGLSYLKPDYPLWQMPFRPRDVLRRARQCRTVMKCRAELVRIMPERLEKLPYVFPFRRNQKYPSWLVDLAFRFLTLFEDGVPLAYRRISAEKARANGLVAAIGPGLRSVGYLEEYQYHWAERMCVDTALEAERLGATISTYTRVTRIQRSNNGWSLNLTDETGVMLRPMTMNAKLVVNAAGPWIDTLTPQTTGYQKHVAKLKGVNLLVRLPDSWRGTGLQTFSSRAEGLGLYLMPWGNYHFIGPTETAVTDDPDNIRITPDEVDYLLGETNSIFPGLNLTNADVVHGWTGVRPWSTDKRGRPTAPVLVREHNTMAGVFTVTGVTIMLNRHAGRLVRKAVSRRLMPSRIPMEPGQMRQRGRDFDRDCVDPIQIVEILKNEHVVTLGDLVRRRLPIGWDADLGLSKLQEVSRIVAGELGWSDERRIEECERYRRECADQFLPISDPLLYQEMPTEEAALSNR